MANSCDVFELATEMQEAKQLQTTPLPEDWKPENTEYYDILEEIIPVYTNTADLILKLLERCRELRTIGVCALTNEEAALCDTYGMSVKMLRWFIQHNAGALYRDWAQKGQPKGKDAAESSAL